MYRSRATQEQLPSSCRGYGSFARGGGQSKLTLLGYDLCDIVCCEPLALYLEQHFVMNNTLAVEYPDTLPDALHMSRAEFEREARFAMAAKLFESGKLTSGQAARLAGVGKVQFLAELGRLNVSSVQIDVAELEQDLATAVAARGHH